MQCYLRFRISLSGWSQLNLLPGFMNSSLRSFKIGCVLLLASDQEGSVAVLSFPLQKHDRTPEPSIV